MTADEYSPEEITYWLSHWPELQSAAEGGTGTLNGHGGGSGKRHNLVLVLADLEAAADKLPLDWTSTLEIFRMQNRLAVWRRRRLQMTSMSVDQAVYRMAQALGWRPS